MNAIVESKSVGAMAVVSAEVMEQVIAKGDLAALTPQQRLEYYRGICESLGLNPLTRPLEYLTLSGKLVLYARKDAAEQLRKLHSISLSILDRTISGDLVIVTARATDKHGRTDEDVGAVNVANLKGDAAANAVMKAITKAKRRVTLSICGLGFLDESEIDVIPDARAVLVDTTTGEILEPSAPTARPEPPAELMTADQRIQLNDCIKEVAAARGTTPEKMRSNLLATLAKKLGVPSIGLDELTADHHEWCIKQLGVWQAAAHLNPEKTAGAANDRTD